MRRDAFMNISFEPQIIKSPDLQARPITFKNVLNNSHYIDILIKSQKGLELASSIQH